MAPHTIVIFLYFLFFGCVLADDGDDFSNNLFTDLGPYDSLSHLSSYHSVLTGV